jgi:hypothetical protein
MQYFGTEFFPLAEEGFSVTTVSSRQFVQRQDVTSLKKHFSALYIGRFHKSFCERDVFCMDQIPEAGMYEEIAVFFQDDFSLRGSAANGPSRGMNEKIRAE